MEEKAAKVAVSLPQETFKEVEQMRQELGLARSAAFLQAIRLWLHQKRSEELEKRYIEGYRKKPEHPADIDPFFRAGLSSFTPEKW